MPRPSPGGPGGPGGPEPRKARGRPRLTDTDRARRRLESRKKYDVRRVYLGEAHGPWVELRRRSGWSDAKLAAYLLGLERGQRAGRRGKPWEQLPKKPKRKKRRRRNVNCLRHAVLWYEDHGQRCPYEPRLAELEPALGLPCAAVWQCERGHRYFQDLQPPPRPRRASDGDDASASSSSSCSSSSSSSSGGCSSRSEAAAGGGPAPPGGPGPPGGPEALGGGGLRAPAPGPAAGPPPAAPGRAPLRGAGGAAAGAGGARAAAGGGGRPRPAPPGAPPGQDRGGAAAEAEAGGAAPPRRAPPSGAPPGEPPRDPSPIEEPEGPTIIYEIPKEPERRRRSRRGRAPSPEPEDSPETPEEPPGCPRGQGGSAASGCQSPPGPEQRGGLSQVSPRPGCGRSLHPAKHLRRQRGVASGPRQFSCGTCGKAFKRKNHLEVHGRTHTGETPLQVCGFRCRQRASLTWHMRRHGGLQGAPEPRGT
ncbi:LOW QUALITY PROTEIN: zinc finger protein 653 [Passer domesticus]|uniref:LOW QUALITY PROTEIN: zinc finger protein 653 n=1 Tax=Passer domesticus TaxID=48849 RepID=UPI0030FE655F